MIGVLHDPFERCAAVKDAAASRTEHIPGHLERPYAGGVEKGGDGFLFIEMMFFGESQRIDTIEIAIGAMPDDVFDTFDRLRVSRLSQGGKKDVHFAHLDSLYAHDRTDNANGAIITRQPANRNRSDRLLAD
ncbi:UNVERIFIED_ORG: hypothetical protein GGI63_003102 [Rhizobium esperanzae]